MKTIYKIGLGALGIGLFLSLFDYSEKPKDVNHQIIDAYRSAQNITADCLFDMVDKNEITNYHINKLTWEQVRPVVEHGFTSTNEDDRIRATILSNSFNFYNSLRPLNERVPKLKVEEQR